MIKTIPKALALCFPLALLSACGGKSDKPEGEASPSPTVAATVTPEASPAATPTTSPEPSSEPSTIPSSEPSPAVPNLMASISVDVTGSALKRVSFDITTEAPYANVNIQSDGIVLLDNLDVVASGTHALNAAVNFGSTGNKTLEFYVRGGEAVIENVELSDINATEFPSFTDIAADIGLIDDNSLKYSGPTVADMNNDGYYDLVLNNHNDSPSKLYWNNAGTSVTKNEGDLALWNLMDLHGTAAGDYDNDGDLDLLVTLGGGNGTSPQPPVFYVNDGDRVLNTSTATQGAPIGLTSGARGRSARWGDFDLDGDLDLALFNAAGINGETGAQHIFYRNDGEGAFELVDVLGLGYTAGDRLLMLDFNKDGIDDFLITSPLSLWQGNGDYTFTNVTTQWIPEEHRGVYGGYAAADMDLDNDGDNEVYITRGYAYYSVSNAATPSMDFNAATGIMDIYDSGERTESTEISFSADGDISMSHYDHTIVRSRYDGEFNVYLGANKAEQTPESNDETNVITQAAAEGWPEDRSENGVYIGYIGDGQWRLEVVRSQFISWGIGYRLEGLSSVETEWDANNRNLQDILLINEGDHFSTADASWNIPQGGNHWGVTYGDFNNDSFNDIFVYRYGYIRDRIADYTLLNTGNNSFEIVTSQESTHTAGVSHADSGQAFDFDLDGDVDILSGDDQYGNWHLFRNDADASANYSLVRVGYSPIENIDPISAQVVVQTTNNTYYKRVGSAGESHSQSLLNTVHFGLGDESSIESVSIRWRNGETVYLTGPDANTVLQSDDGEFPEPTSLTVTPASESVRVGVADLDLDIILDPVNANPAVNWSSSNDAIATVDTEGVVTGVSVGTANITASSVTNGESDFAEIEVIPYVPYSVESVSVTPETAFVLVDQELNLSATVMPERVDDASVTWGSSDDGVATVSDSGVVRGIADGDATITATTADGGYEDKSEITVETYRPTSMTYVNRESFLSEEFSTSEPLEISLQFEAGNGETVLDGGDGGIIVWFRELNSGWTPVEDATQVDATVIGTTNGVATVSFDISDRTPTAELPDGNFYFIWARMTSSSGDVVGAGVGSPTDIITLVDDE
ncbi:FG-GAP-like repeat-containing protein [Agaribacterium sp. ZY112]|uniref:FG-GAP-like repeat-containing protein n=1 Tax=Agaribacterium sp. ZY112 TaxID=3233574 RepID=UPI00352605E2